MRVLVAIVAASVALLGVYLALGGGSYEPAAVANPCEPRPPAADPEGTDEVVQQIALSALDGAACELRVTREDLLAALADPEARTRFLDENRIADETLEAAVRAGLDRAYDDAVDAGRLDGLDAILVGEAIDLVPVSVIVDIAQSESAQDAAAALEEGITSDEAGDALDTIEGLID
jgi:hypothetical protein